MKLWVRPWRVPPPVNQTILARYGGWFAFVAYSRWQDQWFLLCGGREEKLEGPPDLWFCDADYANEHEIPGAVAPFVLETEKG